MTNWVMNCFYREFAILWRNRKSVLNACLFFIMVMVLFPLGFEADAGLLKHILPGLIWIGALFVLYLSSELMFHQEFYDGVLTQWVLSAHSIETRVRAKLLAHTVVFCLPLIAFCSLIGVLYGIGLKQTILLMMALACGMPTILCLCAFAQIFSFKNNQKGVFTALIVLPLMLPVLIFGGGVVTQALINEPVDGPFILLLALSIFSFWTMPYLIGIIIRLNVADDKA